MINFLDSEQDYIAATSQLHQVFQKGVDIIENPFNPGFTIFRAFEFDRIYGANFYHGLIDFLRKREEEKFTFYTLIPDPVEYFFTYFSKYSIGRIPASASHTDFWDFLNADPGNPADSLMDNAETIAIYSNEPIWGIVGSRDIEIGIVGFKDEKVKNEFISCFNEDVFIEIKTRLSDLDKMLKLSPDTKAIHSQIIESYSRK